MRGFAPSPNSINKPYIVSSPPGAFGSPPETEKSKDIHLLPERLSLKYLHKFDQRISLDPV